MAETNNFGQKKALKSIVRDSLTKTDAIKALTGEDKEPMELLLNIGGDNPQKWFLNGEPISQERFNKLSLECKGSVIVTSGGKVFGRSKTVSGDNDKT
jgi:membrane carboxypeptidase/penicillin-binding protein PbpC